MNDLNWIISNKWERHTVLKKSTLGETLLTKCKENLFENYGEMETNLNMLRDYMVRFISKTQFLTLLLFHSIEENGKKTNLGEKNVISPKVWVDCDVCCIYGFFEVLEVLVEVLNTYIYFSATIQQTIQKREACNTQRGNNWFMGNAIAC